MKRIYQPVQEWIWGDRLTIPSCTVVEREAAQQFSGLLDASGNKLMVTLKSEPAGFVVFSEK